MTNDEVASKSFAPLATGFGLAEWEETDGLGGSGSGSQGLLPLAAWRSGPSVRLRLVIRVVRPYFGTCESILQVVVPRAKQFWCICNTLPVPLGRILPF